jgi:hypothetical protein
MSQFITECTKKPIQISGTLNNLPESGGDRTGKSRKTSVTVTSVRVEVQTPGLKNMKQEW